MINYYNVFSLLHINFDNYNVVLYIFVLSFQNLFYKLHFSILLTIYMLQFNIVSLFTKEKIAPKTLLHFLNQTYWTTHKTSAHIRRRSVNGYFRICKLFKKTFHAKHNISVLYFSYFVEMYFFFK